jgi:hypothetical protein
MSQKQPAGMGHHRCPYIDVMLATEGNIRISALL